MKMFEKKTKTSSTYSRMIVYIWVVMVTCYLVPVLVGDHLMDACFGDDHPSWITATSRINQLKLRAGLERLQHWIPFFPTCQVRVVRFYVSCLLLPRPPPPPPRPPPPLLLVLLVLLVVLVVFVVLVVLVQLRPAIHSVLCRTSTTTIHAQCSLPDLNHDHPRPVFPAGPQPRPATPSVPCRTWTTTIHAQCSLPDLNREDPCQVFPAGPQPRVSTPSVPCRTSCRKIWDKECAEES